MKRHNLHRYHGQNKGQYVSRKVYDWRNSVRALRQKKPEKESEVIPEDNSFGRRIVDLRTLAQSLYGAIFVKSLFYFEM